MTLYAMIKEMITTKWIKAKCLVCGLPYEYVKDGYQPKTCADFDCIQKFAHHPEEYLPQGKVK